MAKTKNLPDLAVCNVYGKFAVFAGEDIKKGQPIVTIPAGNIPGYAVIKNGKNKNAKSHGI